MVCSTFEVLNIPARVLMLFHDPESVENMIQSTWNTPALPVNNDGGGGTDSGRTSKFRWSSKDPFVSWAAGKLGSDASIAVKNMRAFVPADDQAVQVVDPLATFAVSPPPTEEWNISRDDMEWERVQSKRQGDSSSDQAEKPPKLISERDVLKALREGA